MSCMKIVPSKSERQPSQQCLLLPYRKQPTRETDNLAFGVERGGANSAARHGCLRDLEGSGRHGHLDRKKASGEDGTLLLIYHQRKNVDHDVRGRKKMDLLRAQRQQTRRGGGKITTLIQSSISDR